MSVRIMSAVFDSDLPSTQRLVMLSLADHADDEGRCYPSISRLCKRTGLSERAIQSNLKKLQEDGYLTIEINAGPKGCNVFFVHPDPRSICTPAGDAPPQEMRQTPAGDAPPPPQEMHPNHHITIIEPPIRKKRAKQSQIDPDALVTEGMIKAGSKRGHSLTETSAQFEAFKASAIAKGRTYANWDMAFVTWLDSPYFKPRTGGNHERPHQHSQAGERTDPALANIARIVGVDQAQRDGST